MVCYLSKDHPLIDILLSDQNINHEKLLLFLDENMGRVSPYFHEFGYLTQEGVLAVVENILSNTSNRTMLCCEFGPRKKSLALIIPLAINAAP